MASGKPIQIPDIGGSDKVDVIEVFVKPGDTIKAEDSLITLESEKATMEIPAPEAGQIASVEIKVGDKVAAGDVILHLQANGTDVKDKVEKKQEKASEPKKSEAKETSAESNQQQTSAADEAKSVTIPDIGTSDNVDVIDVLVNVGDEISEEQALLTLEGEKATMDVPAPFAGKISEVHVKVGDKVKQGSKVFTVQTKGEVKTTEEEAQPKKEAEPQKQPESTPEPQQQPQEQPSHDNSNAYAGPAVRRLAREFGVDLSKVVGTGRKDRILKEDVQKYVKTRLSSASNGIAIPPPMEIDFSKFGEIDQQPLGKIKRLTGMNVHRSWVTVPHVTQFDEADITDLEAFRKANKAQVEAQGAKLTPLVFIMKAVVAALKQQPQFNASLSSDGEQLVLKKYIHIGVAVDTPNGLVVPVIRNVDQKGIVQLALELAEMSQKARDKKLMPADMEGSSFTISSLGGIGGTAFTPIVKLPDVAILGVSKAQIKPVYQQDNFVPRLMLPLSLSYDHRVIDGAEAAQFTKNLSFYLSDVRRVLL